MDLGVDMEKRVFWVWRCMIANQVMMASLFGRKDGLDLVRWVGERGSTISDSHAALDLK